ASCASRPGPARPAGAVRGRRQWPARPCLGCGCSSSLLLATLVFELELGAQQAALIIRHAEQPGLVRLPTFLVARVARDGTVIRCRPVLPASLLQRLLHALALLAVGLGLGGWVWHGRAGRRIGRRIFPSSWRLRSILALFRILCIGAARRGIAGLGSSWCRLAILSRLRPATAVAGRRRPLAACGLDHLAVGQRVLHARRLGQGPVIGGKGLVVTPLAGQRI